MPLQIVRDNITRMRCDAIVNPTDELFSHTGGVDAEVHHAAGEALYAACLAKGSLSVGEACLTEGFLLPCRYVIHTVGPRWRGGAHGEAEALRACYRAVLRLATEAGCGTVALPLRLPEGAGAASGGGYSHRGAPHLRADGVPLCL